MKQAFAIMKDRPMVDIRVTRDSVAAGDDADAPHERRVQVHSFLDPVALVRELYPGYLPSVAGVGHSWDCMLNDVLIATITVDGIRPRAREVRYAEENHVHFVYRSATY